MRNIFTFIIGALIIYSALEQTNFKPIKNFATKATEENQIKDPNYEKFEGGWLEKKISKIIVNIAKTPEGERFLQNLIQPMNDNTHQELEFKSSSREILKNLLSIKIIKPGFGVAANCGSRVKITYEIFDLKNTPIKADKISLKLGENKINKPIENAIIGMRVGEVREAKIYPKMLGDTSLKAPINVKLTLEELENTLNSDDIKIFDDTISFSKPVLCGDKVKYDLRITDIAGNIISEGKDLAAIIGNDNTPPAISYGLFNKSGSGVRTIIARGEFLINKKDKNYLKNTDKIRSNEYYLIELKNLEDDEEKVYKKNK